MSSARATNAVALAAAIGVLEAALQSLRATHLATVPGTPTAIALEQVCFDLLVRLKALRVLQGSRPRGELAS